MDQICHDSLAISTQRSSVSLRCAVHLSSTPCAVSVMRSVTCSLHIMRGSGQTVWKYSGVTARGAGPDEGGKAPPAAGPRMKALSGMRESV